MSPFWRMGGGADILSAVRRPLVLLSDLLISGIMDEPSM